MTEKSFQGKSLTWEWVEGIIELGLHHPPCNEIGTGLLVELEWFISALELLAKVSHTLIIHSQLNAGFSAGADLRELWHGIQGISSEGRKQGIRSFLERIHRVMNAIDTAPLLTIAALHGVTFGGGFELALTCDLLIADKTTRFCFPELRLGLIPGFGGIPRLKRDISNAAVRDLLLTGRSLNASRAWSIGLVSQLVSEGQALTVARRTAGQQGKFNAETRTIAKSFIKPLPAEELKQEMDIFCELASRPAMEEGLRRFLENTGPQPYLP